MWSYLVTVFASPPILIFSVVAPLLIIFVIAGWRKGSKPSDPTVKHVSESQITALIIYPIKSCGGISLEECKFDAFGLEFDRRWMLAFKRTGNEDPDSDKNDGRLKADYKLLSQRLNPKMALLTPTLQGDKLIISAPSKPPIEVELSSQISLLMRNSDPPRVR